MSPLNRECEMTHTHSMSRRGMQQLDSHSQSVWFQDGPERRLQPTERDQKVDDHVEIKR